MNIAPDRPILRYHGGKWELAPWIISNLPDHRVYVEPFGGAASVLLQKPRSYGEVYNDLDGEVVNLFRVLRDSPEELCRRIMLTPFSRSEYLEAFQKSDDAIEWARRILIRSHMGFAGAATHGRMTGFRSSSTNSGTHPASQWKSLPSHFAAVVDRWHGVVIENRPALEVIAQQDNPETLFYVDPPYVLSSRDGGSDYRYEMTDDQHQQLAAALSAATGMVVLSGYRTPLYEFLYGPWKSKERLSLAEGARERTEVLWFNDAAWNALQARDNCLFGVAP